MHYRRLYSTVGIFLGIGAPIGAIVGRALWFHRAWWINWLTADLRAHTYFYVYMAVGCVLVFTVFGFVLGGRADAMQSEADSLTGTFQTLNLLAIKDGLTSLYNHRYLQERLSLEMDVADRRKTPLTCLMIDIDNFKSVNDRYGHPFGDMVLTTIARLIRENVRTIDTAGRYGGEEFMIVMPQTAAEVAMGVAERIRATVENYPFHDRVNKARVTLSIGVSTYPTEGIKIVDKGAFLQTVDDALYQAKNSGKNRLFYLGQKKHGRELQEESR